MLLKSVRVALSVWASVPLASQLNAYYMSLEIVKSVMIATNVAIYAYNHGVTIGILISKRAITVDSPTNVVNKGKERDLAQSYEYIEVLISDNRSAVVVLCDDECFGLCLCLVK